MKKRMRIILAVLLVALQIFVQPFAGVKVMAASDEGSSTVGDSSTVTEEPADILLLHGNLVFYGKGTNNPDIFKNLNMKFDLAGKDEVLKVDFSKYKVIYVSGHQLDDFTNLVAARKADLDKFVAEGGILFYGATSDANDLGPNMHIPGGIKCDPQFRARYNNLIIDATHPLITGEISNSTPLTNNDVKSNYFSHRYFLKSTVPQNANIILTDETGENPTLVEYRYGKGLVVATTVNWEFLYKQTDLGKRMYGDLIKYVYSMTKNLPGEVNTVITTDKDTYLPDETLKANFESTILNYKRNVKGVVEILDSNKKTVATLPTNFQQDIETGKKVTNEATWKVANLTAGVYYVKVTWTDKNEVVGSSIKPITIGNYTKISNRITLGRTDYSQSDTLSVSNVITNNSVNDVKDALDVKMYITNNGSVNIPCLTKNIKELAAESSVTFQDLINFKDLADGKYTLKVDVVKGTEVVSTYSVDFNVIEKVNLKGNLQVTDSTIANEKRIDATVENIGTKYLPGLKVRVRVMDSKQTTVAKTFETSVDLLESNKATQSYTLNMKDLVAGEYVAVLDATTQDGKNYTLATVNLSSQGQSTDQPIDYDSIKYLLVATGMETLKIEGSLANIYGDVYSNSDFIYNGSEITVKGALNAVEEVKVAGSAKVKTTNANATELTLPDYSKTIVANLPAIVARYNNVEFTDAINIDNGVYSSEDLQIKNPKLNIKKDLVAVGDIVIDSNKITLGSTGRVVVCSLEGDITINAADITGNVFFYAPNGRIKINGSKLDIKGRIIGDTIVLRGSLFSFKN